MHHKEDDLQFLVGQTIDMAEKHQGLNPFGTFDSYETTGHVPEGPGILYRVQKSMQHMCLRMTPVANIKESYECYQENKHLFPNLNKGEVHELTPLEFFATEYSDVADVICDTLSNQRFTLYEDRFDAISDTSINW